MEIDFPEMGYYSCPSGDINMGSLQTTDCIKVDPVFVMVCGLPRGSLETFFYLQTLSDTGGWGYKCSRMLNKTFLLLTFK